MNELALDLFNVFAVALDPIFAPLLAFKPHVTLFLFAAILTAVIFAINRLMVNQKEVKEIKESLATVREKLAQAQKAGKKDEVNNLLNEMMTINNRYLRQTFKVLIISFVVLVVLFPWANHRFGDVTVVSHPFVSLLSVIPLVNLIPNWLVWYILSSISISWLLRKFIGE